MGLYKVKDKKELRRIIEVSYFPIKDKLLKYIMPIIDNIELFDFSSMQKERETKEKEKEIEENFNFLN